MKRILALVLALLSCVGLLSGCGGDTAGDRPGRRSDGRRHPPQHHPLLCGQYAQD